MQIPIHHAGLVAPVENIDHYTHFASQFEYQMMQRLSN
jgi:hypothetical protein